MNCPTFSLRSFARLAVSALAATALVTAAAAQADPPSRRPDLPAGCEALEVPAGHVVTLSVYAVGVQTYRWNAATLSWTFTGPQALLFPNAHTPHPIGVHSPGPIWEVAGGTVAGSVVANHTVDPTAVPWLLLAASSTGTGVVADTAFVQRINTTGGRAPSWNGFPDEVVAVPYTAEYYFYRAL